MLLQRAAMRAQESFVIPNLPLRPDRPEPISETEVGKADLIEIVFEHQVNEIDSSSDEDNEVNNLTRLTNSRTLKTFY